ncbi:MAG: cytochrome c, partial [Mesorhizobium sp.]
MKFLIAAALATMACQASTAQEMSYGEAEYLNSCAVCHGLHGKGDGPLGNVLLKRPADL